MGSSYRDLEIYSVNLIRIIAKCESEKQKLLDSWPKQESNK